MSLLISLPNKTSFVNQESNELWKLIRWERTKCEGSINNLEGCPLEFINVGDTSQLHHLKRWLRAHHLKRMAYHLNKHNNVGDMEYFKRIYRKCDLDVLHHRLKHGREHWMNYAQIKLNLGRQQRSVVAKWRSEPGNAILTYDTFNN